MVKMDTNHISDRLQKIWLSIDQLHLGYLEMEESPEKLDHRNRLEDCIRDFLCIASHPQKFSFRETLEVLHRSAANKKDFSAYKAATGWNAIQLYAGNLLSQPWRKEYRLIKNYCGFYKHQIEANLVGADMLFEAMGYKHCGNGILTLDAPICPDRVANISKDCLIAYVECQILKTIWEEVSQTCKITWLEVLEFRKNHACSPEQAIRILTFQFYQSQSNGYQTVPPCMYAPSPYCPTYAHVPANSYHPYHMPVQYAPIKQAPMYCSNGYHGIGQHNLYAVPTAQLIEVESQHQNNSVDVVDRPGKKDHQDDWDYVYRDLASQGYSKDLGERGDILNPNHAKPTNLDEMMRNLTLKSKEKSVQKHRGSDKSSSYDNLSEPVHKKSGATATKLKVIDEPQNKWECKSCTYLNDHSKDICEICSKSKHNVEQHMEIGGPQCPKCTLVNLRQSKLCQACGENLKGSPTYI